jgi:hypothetical protein
MFIRQENYCGPKKTIRVMQSVIIKYRKTSDAGPGFDSIVNDVCCRFKQSKVFEHNFLTLRFTEIVQSRTRPGSSKRDFTVDYWLIL